jgi:drug/metabolite transporter (DMT)-like permease
MNPSPAGKPPRAAVHVALLFVQIAFGSLAVEGKLAMSPRFGVSPPALAMARILGGALVFAPLALAQGGPRVRALRDVAELTLLALFGVVLNQALFLAGLRQTSPVSATLLIATIPVFTVVIAALAGRERLRLRGAAGIALALTGALALSGFALPRRGDAMVMLNSASYAIYIVFSKRALARLGPMTVITWVFGAGAVLFAPIGGRALLAEAPAWPPTTVALVAFIVLVPTAFAYSVNAWALARATPALVTVYVYFQPLVVVALAWAQLDQPPEPRAVLAGLFILAGVGLVATAPRQGPDSAMVQRSSSRCPGS